MSASTSTPRTKLSAAQQALFERRLRGAAAGRTSISPSSRPTHLPLSYPQRRLWFVDRLKNGSSAYNIIDALRLRGDLHEEALQRALNAVVQRHEVLRTHFEEIDGQPVQIIAAVRDVSPRVEDLRHLAPEEQHAFVQEALAREAALGFDLARGPVLRVRLLQLGDAEYVLLRTVHHIAGDAWSLGIWTAEIFALYDAFRHERPSPLPALPIQYADFAVWQRSAAAAETADQGMAYWETHLAGVPDRLELPTDRVRPPIQSFAAGVCTAAIPASRVEPLKRLAAAHGATLYMTLLAALAAVLARHSGQEDFTIGSPIAGRPNPQLEQLIGCFVETLVLRIRAHPSLALGALLDHVRETALEAYDHLDVPFERLVEKLAPNRSLAAPPLVQVVFAFLPAPTATLPFADLDVEPIGCTARFVRNDLEVNAWEHDGQVSFTWTYPKALFDAARIEMMTRHYDRVLDALLDDDTQPIGRVALLDAAERSALLYDRNETTAAVPIRTLPALVEAQVSRTPDAAAIVAQTSVVSYAALEGLANHFARQLIAKGARPEHLVALAIPRSIAQFVALLATVKSGAAYLPLDPDYPAERLRMIFDDTRPLCLLTTTALAHRYDGIGIEVIAVDDVDAHDLLTDGSTTQPVTDRDRLAPLRPEHAAYVIYTSGSTGRPKGVIVPHRGLASIVATLQRSVDPGPGARILQFAPLTFDASVWDVMMALATGGALVLPHPERPLDDVLDGGVIAYNVTHATLPPAVAAIVPVQAAATLRSLVIAGEACPSAVVTRWAPVVQLIDAYGLTEATICTTMTEALPHDAVPPIGRPIVNARAYVLDASLEPVPDGLAAELYISGVGLARGYLQRPALTAERFVADPYGAPGSRMYRTGDLARWSLRGELEYLGRTDRQVKVRGLRIEVGEIEAALTAMSGVAGAAVVARGDRPEERRLVGYVKTSGSGVFDARAIADRLRERLPEYLVPEVIVEIDEWPLTRSGKIDREALPNPGSRMARHTRVPPRTPEEEVLCQLFAEVLEVDVDAIGIDDDFFESGGHSLSAVGLVSRVRSALGVELMLDAVFEAPRVRDLAMRLRDSGPRRSAVRQQPRPDRLPLSYGQQRLWFLDRLQGGSPEYNAPEAIRLRGALDRPALRQAIDAIVSRHESLRTHFAQIDGAPVQVISESLQLELPEEDVRALPADRQRAYVETVLKEEAAVPFDLARGPLLRLRLVQLGEHEHVVVRTLHHIVSDAWSNREFARELAVLYDAFRLGQPNPLPPLPVQYADFALWQRALIDASESAELAYWTRKLAGIPARAAIATDRPRSSMQTFQGDVYHTHTPLPVTAGLKELGRSHQATLFMTLLAAFAAVLARHTGQDDIVVGAPISNRRDAELDELIGFFLNTLVMRIRVTPSLTFRELLSQVRDTALEAYQHQDMPFERLVEQLAPTRSLNTTPVFQVTFSCQHVPPDSDVLGDLALEPVSGDVRPVHFDMEVHAADHARGVTLAWIYNRDLFDRWRIEQMARHYQRILESVTVDPDAQIWAIDLLGPAKREQVLQNWSAAAGRSHDERVYVLDHRLEPLPPGATGELYIGGNGGAEERPAVLAGHLIADPYGAPSSRMRRTGDLARWTPDGTLGRLGRADDYVTVSGVPVLLRDVDAALREEPGVEDAAVVASSATGGTNLAAYVVAAANRPLLRTALRRRLRQRLPEYMVPATITVLPALPRTASGRLDQAALPAPQPSSPAEEYRPPRSAREEALCDILADLVGVDRVGIEDNFFDLGGHSLLIPQAVTRLRDVFDVEPPIRSIYETPTVGDLASALGLIPADVSDALNELATAGRVCALRDDGAKEPLFCLPPPGGIGWNYVGVTRQLNEERPVYAVQPAGLTGDDACPQAMDAIVNVYCALIRAIQPSGRYHLVGTALGGLFAHAVACRLQHERSDVALLAIVDGYLPPTPAADGSSPEWLQRVSRDVQQARADFPDGGGRDEPHVATLARGAADLASRYRPDVFDGNILCVSAAEPSGPDDDWSAVVSGTVERCRVACDGVPGTSLRPMIEIGLAIDAYLAKRAD